MVCDKCSRIEEHRRYAQGHSDLENIGAEAAVHQPYGQSRVNIQKYRCRHCGALWSYTDDKNDSFEGWSLESHV
jgi:hypothetical protein